MVSITDIGPLTKEISLRGKSTHIRGVPAIILFDILRDSEAMKKLFLERELNADNVMSLINSAPIMLGQVLAAGLGHHGEQEFIDAATRNLAAGEQLEILQAMLEVSFPHGLPAFLQNMQALAGIDASKSASGLFGGDQDTKSQPQSPDASATDTEQTTHG